MRLDFRCTGSVPVSVFRTSRAARPDTPTSRPLAGLAVVEAPRWAAPNLETTMSKLTDTQLVILSAAGARSDHAVLPPPGTLTLNKAALTKVINSLLSRGLVTEKRAAPTDIVWREEGDQRLTLFITTTGLTTIGIESDEDSVQPGEENQDVSGGDKPSARGTGKPDAVLGLLNRPEGAGIADINAVTGWQAHSIRAFISGLRKKGLEISRTKDDGGKAVYRIIGGDVR
jgi:hypothetical protein